jgi:hypothetical protein
MVIRAIKLKKSPKPKRNHKAILVLNLKDLKVKNAPLSTGAFFFLCLQNELISILNLLLLYQRVKRRGARGVLFI